MKNEQMPAHAAMKKKMKKSVRSYAKEHKMAPPQTDANAPKGRMQISRKIGPGKTNYTMGE